MAQALDPQAAHKVDPLFFFSSPLRNKRLIIQMARRELLARYTGSFLGLSWALLNSLLFLAVYTFVFGYVFKASWRGAEDAGQLSFAIVLFLGLSIHGLLSECITRAPAIVLTNVTYVKKVVFPLELLAWVSLLTAMFQFVVALLVWVLVFSISGGKLGANALYFLGIIPPLFFWSLGFLWLFSSLGVFLRDISQLTGVLSMVLLFVAPIFYPISTIPADIKWLLLINPLTPIVENSRAVLLDNNLPDFQALGISYLSSVIFAWFSFVWFQKTRKGFADVI